MATTIINPTQADNSASNGIGLILGIIVLLAFVFLFLFYGIPFIRGLSSAGNGVQVTVPKNINVNVQQTK